MTLKPLVSVIMNCHNSEKYLSEAIDSIINQTYSNWELIFWDNKSSDKKKLDCTLNHNMKICNLLFIKYY